MSTSRPRRLSIYDQMQFENQPFSLPFSTMNQLIENANAKSMKSLQKTCKFFYFKRQIFITDSLFVDHFISYGNYIKCQNLKLIKSKLWLHEKLTLCCKLSAYRLLPKVFKCELSFLFIEEEVHLTLSDLKFFTNPGTIKGMSLCCKVYECQNNLIPIPVHRILALVPTAIYLGVESAVIERKAMESFLKEERAVKFQLFELYGTIQWLDPNVVLQFIKINLTFDAKIRFNFGTRALNQEFRNAVEPEIRSVIDEFSVWWLFINMGL